MKRLIGSTLVLGLVGVALAAGTSGSLDTTFDGDGLANTPAGDALSLAAQSDGKLVAAGTLNGTSSTFRVVRYDSDGTLDTGFGSGGIVDLFDSAVGSQGQHVSIDGNGKILVAGGATIERTSGRGKKQTTVRIQGFALARLQSNGNADSGFGDGGELFEEVPGTNGAVARAAVFQSDGKIVVVGMGSVKSDKPKGKAGRGVPDYNQALVLARFDSDGTLDASFGTDGFVIDDVSKDDDIAGLNGLALQSDGKIVVAAMVRDVTSGDGYDDHAVILSRYDTDGTLDTSFGSGGTVTLAGETELPSIAIDSQDRILLAAGGSDGGFVERYDADGTLDTGFGSSGRYETGLTASNRLRGVALLSDGTIVAAGEAGDNGFTLRLDADGDLDATYGISDLTTPSDSVFEFFFDLAIDADGNYVIAGGKSGSFFLARYCQ